MTPERRRNPRHAVELPAEVSSANELLIGETVDLSLGGVRIVVDDMLDVGATVRLTLSVPAASAVVVSKSAAKPSSKPSSKPSGKSSGKPSSSAAAKAPGKAKAANSGDAEDDSGMETDGHADGDGETDTELDPDLDAESGNTVADDEPFESSMTVRWTRARPDGRCIIGLSFGPLTAAERKELARVLATLAPR